MNDSPQANPPAQPKTARTHPAARAAVPVFRRAADLALSFLPFLRWFPVDRATFKSDLTAGVTVALVLIPQSMAYAQLAGLPVVYGLYAAFVPVIVAALWGSCAQLHTGPTAMLSLLTAAALAPLAAAGSPHYIALAVMLALMVGVFRLLLGVFKLGVLVNFLSHPVIVGFTNAAALIIGLSQLAKLFNVPGAGETSFVREIWGVLMQIGDAHLPTVLMGVFALAIILGLQRYAPRVPAILVAVTVTTLVSWVAGFEHNQRIALTDIDDPAVKTAALELRRTHEAVARLNVRIAERTQALRQAEARGSDGARRAIQLGAELQLLKMDLDRSKQKRRLQQRALRNFILAPVPAGDGKGVTYITLDNALRRAGPEAKAPERWRISALDADGLLLMGGGQVIGRIPSGLPRFEAPTFEWGTMLALLPSALVMALIGFMEAISISRAIAARTRQRIDPNRELIGQGLGNIAGSFFQSYVVSGSFSRSALNTKAGAKTGLASVISAAAVVLVLLFLTPLLYHLPQAVLAVIVMLAVAGLINFRALIHAWHAQKQDAVAGGVTFVATLALAPRLEQGILLGAGLAIVLFLFRTMKPRVALLSRAADGTLRDARAHNLPVSEHVVALRVDRSLYFANVSYFEDTVLQAIRQVPTAKYLLVVGDGINEIDASGEEMLRKVHRDLHDTGVTLVFSGLKKQVLDVLHKTGLFGTIGAQHFFNNTDTALATLRDWIDHSDVELGICPLTHPEATHAAKPDKPLSLGRPVYQ
jgi:sulfate permease, SulP family